MAEQRVWERRVRLEIEIGKEIPSEETLRRWDEALARTPNAVRPQPYNRVWISSIQASDPDDPERVVGGYPHNWTTSLGGALDDALRWLRFLVVSTLARETAPIDRRLAASLGTPGRGATG